MKTLAPRWFVVRNAHGAGDRRLSLLRSRGTFSWLRGPLTPPELRELVARVSDAAT